MNGYFQSDTLLANKEVFAVILFSQIGLDTLHYLEFDTLFTIQSIPFVSLKMEYNNSFLNPKVIDYSYSNSYLLTQLSMESQEMIADVKSVEPAKPKMELFPNPAYYYSNIRINNLNPGKYNLKLFDLQGKLLFQTNMNHLYSTSSIFETIDLQEINTGSYYIIFESQNGIKLSSLLIIQR